MYHQEEINPSVEEPGLKDKYITLLEEHQKLLAKLLAIQEGK